MLLCGKHPGKIVTFVTMGPSNPAGSTPVILTATIRSSLTTATENPSIFLTELMETCRLLL